ncbi:thiol-disulfide oxidoreductase DCC family protein [Catenulispora subtropica]|uniref:DCC1-like thiol-disulfide oxidoreductase family protein n=1 Tax=Catenulispora subtropica TaxID=450798 RepID=A0ABN2SP15_9ACTN
MTAPAPRQAAQPVRGLTVLYDAQCRLCRAVHFWLERQKQLVPLTFVPAGSTNARMRYPGLNHQATLEDITVIGDGGQIFSGDAAWIACLWALAKHRGLAHRLATPAGRPFARAAVLVAAKLRASLTDVGPGTGCADGACDVPAPEPYEGRREHGAKRAPRAPTGTHRF